MDIYCKAGHKVIVTKHSSKNGYSYDVEKVASHLKIGTVYTVARVNVDRYSTDVELEEVPGEIFNSVNFEDYNENHVDPSKWDIEMSVTTKVKVSVEAYSEEDAIDIAKKTVSDCPYNLDLGRLEVKEVISVNKTK